jgi:hypothetical protein
MTPERWREISELFERVADLSPSKRQQILVRAEPEVHREVLSQPAHATAEQGGMGTVLEAVRDDALYAQGAIFRGEVIDSSGILRLPD